MNFYSIMHKYIIIYMSRLISVVWVNWDNLWWVGFWPNPSMKDLTGPRFSDPIPKWIPPSNRYYLPLNLLIQNYTYLKLFGCILHHLSVWLNEFDIFTTMCVLEEVLGTWFPKNLAYVHLPTNQLRTHTFSTGSAWYHFFLHCVVCV